MFLTGNIWRRSGQQLHWWHSNWRLLFESRVMFLWWVLNNCTSVTYFKHRQTTSVRVAVVVNEHPYFVYLINTDSIKSKCLHKNSSIGWWKKKTKKNITTKWPSSHFAWIFIETSRFKYVFKPLQRISVFLIAHRTVKKGFSVGWLTTSCKKYLRQKSNLTLLLLGETFKQFCLSEGNFWARFCDILNVFF